MFGKIELLISQISDFVWGIPMILMLMGTHLFLTFRLKGTYKFIKEGIKISFGKRKDGEGEITHFGALTTALAATVGTGNIAGVATAIA
ncbi:MAG: alanine:cation symporter family protein, partial [Chitinispirillaceae bacterium]|nr:alanine:cation symporter family protein [Chitinispirillaceae bacterium]